MATREDDIKPRKRARVDLTQETPSANRRLDSLAKLLAAATGSICIAVSVMGEKLVITSNDLFAGSQRNNQKFLLIGKVYGYFQNIARDEKLTSEERREIFKTICKNAKQKTTDSTYSGLLEDKFDELIDYVLSGENPRIFDFRRKYGAASVNAAAAYSDFQKLYVAFSKLEESLRQKRESREYDKLDQESFDAFVKGYDILREEKQPGVHAEAQLVSKIWRNVKDTTPSEDQTIYLGISKLCCLDCRVLIEQAAEKLKDKKIILEYRGQHDLSFRKEGKGAGWIPPDEFSAGYAYEASSASSSMPSISFQIGQETRRIADELRGADFEEDGHIYQSPGDSGSGGWSQGSDQLDDSEISVVDILKAPLSKVRRILREVHGCENDWINEMIPVMADLLKIREFSDLTAGALISDTVQEDFLSILARFREIRPEFAEANLIEVLHNSFLVGKALAEHFRCLDDKGLRVESGAEKMAEDMQAELRNKSTVSPPTRHFDDGRDAEMHIEGSLSSTLAAPLAAAIAGLSARGTTDGRKCASSNNSLFRSP